MKTDHRFLLNIEIIAVRAMQQYRPTDDDAWFQAKKILKGLVVGGNPSGAISNCRCSVFSELWRSTGEKIKTGSNGWKIHKRHHGVLMEYKARTYEVSLLQQLAEDIARDGLLKCSPDRRASYQDIASGRVVRGDATLQKYSLADLDFQVARKEFATLLEALVQSENLSTGLTVYRETVYDELVAFCKVLAATNFSPLARPQDNDTGSIRSDFGSRSAWTRLSASWSGICSRSFSRPSRTSHIAQARDATSITPTETVLSDR
jgi:hypothetical protein